LVLAVELVPVVEALRTEELLVSQYELPWYWLLSSSQ
jgi:hypothetical protein